MNCTVISIVSGVWAVCRVGILFCSCVLVCFVRVSLVDGLRASLRQFSAVTIARAERAFLRHGDSPHIHLGQDISVARNGVV